MARTTYFQLMTVRQEFCLPTQRRAAMLIYAQKDPDSSNQSFFFKFIRWLLEENPIRLEIQHNFPTLVMSLRLFATH